MKSIRERRLIGSWPLALFIACGVLIAGCSDEGQEAQEQQPVAPQVAPPSEQQDAERAAEQAQDEATRCPAEEVVTQQPRRHALPSKDRTETDRSRVESGIVFDSGPGSQSAQSRKFRGGPGLSQSGEMQMDGGEVASKPLVPPVSQPRYEFGIYMGTPDQTRGVRPGAGVRIDGGDPPAYSTMKPSTPNVSESTVLPELQ